MGEGRAAPRHQDRTGSSIALFLALYLLLLAFFILLNSISQIQEVKSKAVIQSVTATFAPTRAPDRLPAPRSGDIGDILAIEEVQRDIGDLVRALVLAARVEVRVPGRLMELVLPAEALFVEGENTLRRGRLPFLDRFVAALSTVPSGYVAALEVFLTVPEASRHGFPAGAGPQTARAGALAQALLARGMPETRLTVGLAEGAAGKVRLLVHLFAEEAADGPPRSR